MDKQSSYFHETSLPYGRAGIDIGIEVTETLFDEQTPYSRIQVFDTPFYGKMMAIDGIVQTTELGECVYHEMLVLGACLHHGNPKSMLIIGGGDGGSAKAALNVKSLERIVQVEIDEGVVRASEEHMPAISEGALRHPKVELIIGDGLKFVDETEETFDVVILDLTDPVPDGPAERLFDTPFYRAVKKILNKGGVVSTQSGSLLFQPEEAPITRDKLSRVLGRAVIAAAVVPDYQLSLFAFQYAGNILDPGTLAAAAQERFNNLQQPPKYLTPEVFTAAHAISPFYLK
jgi:spermidine synthase